MEVPTPHILFNILLGLTIIAGFVTALAFALDEKTHSFGICLGLTFIAVSIAQTITQGYSDFNSTPYWWVMLIVAGVSLLLSIWQHTKMPHTSLLNKKFWQQWKRAFWMLFGVMVVAGIIKSIF
jgi:hypothetical protein